MNEYVELDAIAPNPLHIPEPPVDVSAADKAKFFLDQMKASMMGLNDLFFDVDFDAKKTIIPHLMEWTRWSEFERARFEFRLSEYRANEMKKTNDDDDQPVGKIGFVH